MTEPSAAQATFSITDEAGLVVWIKGKAIPLAPPERLVDLAVQALKAHIAWQARTRPSALAVEVERAVSGRDPWGEP